MIIVRDIIIEVQLKQVMFVNDYVMIVFIKNKNCYYLIRKLGLIWDVIDDYKIQVIVVFYV